MKILISIVTLGLCFSLSAFAELKGLACVGTEPLWALEINSVTGKMTDGMSDSEYAYHVIYTNKKEVLYGCCEPKAQH